MIFEAESVGNENIEVIMLSSSTPFRLVFLSRGSFENGKVSLVGGVGEGLGTPGFGRGLGVRLFSFGRLFRYFRVNGNSVTFPSLVKGGLRRIWRRPSSRIPVLRLTQGDPETCSAYPELV